MRVEEDRPTRADPSPPDPFFGQVLGGCRIDEMLGRGGMGVVYKATQLSLNRPVAIKVLAEDVCGQPQFTERFKREVDILSRLAHPNVVTVLERGEIDGRLYVIMEYVRGTSLREVMRKGPLPAAEALVIVRGVLSALEHAHEKGIIHRDIKPENVLVAPGGIVKVADFGLSRVVGPVEATRLTHTQLLLGTFEYMAPEQREKAKQADERADIYATGVVLYEMLAGELPIGHFAALSRKRPKECDSRLDEIVERSLAKSPEDRYQRASEMGAAVSRVLSAATAPPPEHPPSPPPAAPPPEAEPRREGAKKRPPVHVAARLTVEEDARVDAHDRRRRRKRDDPASGVGCIVFLVLLLAHKGLLLSVLGAALAVAIVRGIARSGSGLRTLLGLVAAAAVIGVLFLLTTGGSPEPSWLGRPDVTAVETHEGTLYANIPLGTATGPLPDLDRDFLSDGERVGWIYAARFAPFQSDAMTLRVVGGSVVLSVRAPEPGGDFGTSDLAGFGAVVARALASAYPDSFVAAPTLPEVQNPPVGPAPGPAGEWAFDVATYEGVSDEEAQRAAADVLSDPRVKRYLGTCGYVPPAYPAGIELTASRGIVRAVFKRRIYVGEIAAAGIAGGIGYKLVSSGGVGFRKTRISDMAPVDLADNR